MKNHHYPAGFTVLEMVMVILIIGIVAGAAVGALSDARQRQRDSQRVTDVSELQVALAAYKRDLGVYPSIITVGEEIRGTGAATTSQYLARVPTPPTPQDGDCGSYPAYATYYYLPSGNYLSYSLFFCLGDQTTDLPAGGQVAHPTGIVSGYPD